MAEEQMALSSSDDDFFIRCGLEPQTRGECLKLLREQFAGKVIRPVDHQGYCSYTVLVGDDLVAQFRPWKYMLDLNVTDAAKAVYGSCAPFATYLTTLYPSGLLVYLMERMKGVSYKEFLTTPQAKIPGFRQTLCEDLACLIARSWHNWDLGRIPIGNIGSSWRIRLEKLSEALPDRFKPAALDVLNNTHVLGQRIHGKRGKQSILGIPWVLTHGDLVPSNIMLDPCTGRLVGLVDWAEAEMLPLGTCFYGVEQILGYMTDMGFKFYDDHDVCWQAFQVKLRSELPDLRDHFIHRDFNCARLMGILLWHGFAFDDGAINRVVDPEIDEQEIAYLDALLDTPSFRPEKHLASRAIISQSFYNDI